LKISPIIISISLCLAGNTPDFILPSSTVNNIASYSTVTSIIGVMVDFQIETEDSPDLLTSGNGAFLQSSEDVFDERCIDFHADPPPHNHAYFTSQIKALNNYYKNVSQGSIDLSYHVIDSVYHLPNIMRHYATEDTSLGLLFNDAVNLAQDSLAYYYDDNTIVVIFHAGIGQDFAIPFLDPTPYDLKSAFVDDEIMAETPWPQINGQTLSRGIILPETQNHLYYDVIEEIFFGETDYCDYQVGMTGTFAFLMGYAFGLPPLFNTETGESGIGVFGLMDQGSNNGRGVIPAPPTAWTRILKDWDQYDDINQQGSQQISINYDSGQFHDIHKIKISESEYYLLENRTNRVNRFVDKSIDDIRYDNRDSDNRRAHWFDTVEEEFTQAQIEIDSETGVITWFDHYDYGLPGSGLLIWHINEPEIDHLMDGINNDRQNRSVHLEEADGSVDIGFESYAVFQSDDPTNGRIWDMWYRGNGGFFFANDTLQIPPGDEPFGPNPWFNDSSYPNTESQSGGKTYISIDSISYSGTAMSYVYALTPPFESQFLSDEEIFVSGGYIDEEASDGGLYYILNEQLFRRNQNEIESIAVGSWLGYVLTSSECFQDTFNIDLDQYTDLYINEESCQVESSTNILPMAYLNDDTILEEVEVADALGDIDMDGLDEIITTENGSIFSRNSNSIMNNGFPVAGNFYGNILIANVIGNASPEIICRENDNIVFISNGGERLYEISSYQPEQPLMTIPYWSNDSMAIIDGRRIFLFPNDLDHSYWLFPGGSPSNNLVVTGAHHTSAIPSFGFDKNRAYNYPNPITDNRTTFRYFVGSAASIEIKIYDSSGHLIKNLYNDDLTHNEYNETAWIPGKINPGLYLAEIKPDVGSSNIIQVVYLK
jgi:M6 family metalloprotease-like protein